MQTNRLLSAERNRKSSNVRYGAQLQQKRQPTGFLLLDVMIALTVTTFVLLATISLLLSAAAAADAAKQNTVAYNAARQIIENVRQYKGAAVANNTYIWPETSTSQAEPNLFGPVPQLKAAQSAGLRNASARLDIFTYRASVKQVTVTITWYAGAKEGSRTATFGKMRTRTLTTLISDHGVTP